MMYAGSPAAFMLIFNYFVMDYYHPQGGFQAISDALAGFITERGGQIRYKTRVDEILMERGRARGVRLQDGEALRARFVVSNGDARRTFLKMLPADATEESYKQMLRETPVSESMVAVFLGVDIPAEKLPVQGCQHIYYMPDFKGTDPLQSLNDENYYRRAPVEITITSLQDPSLAPEGKTSIVLQSIAFMDYAGRWGTDNGNRTERYKELKEKVADQLIANAEKVIPGLSEKIEFKAVATPFTHERYTLNSEGASAGWTYNPQKAFNSGKEGIWGFRTPVKNLYLVGHWTMSPGGAPACFMSGKMVSSIIKWRLRLRLGS